MFSGPPSPDFPERLERELVVRGLIVTEPYGQLFDALQTLDGDAFATLSRST
jgi:hypothetical protein